jgi:uncharacterized protein
MQTPEMVIENVGYVERFSEVSEADRLGMERILDEFSTLGKSFCTACGYCMDCPNGVDIPANFNLYNKAKVYGLNEWARGQYAKMDEGKRASACTSCGECEPKCPNTLPIMEQLAHTAATLG